MRSQLKSTSVSHWVIAYAITICAIGFVLHRPLPEGFLRTPVDRFVMHFIEPFLRVTYYWPSRLFPTAGGMVWWTRQVLDYSAWMIGPLFDSDPDLHMETTEWEGVRVRVYSPRHNASSRGAVVFVHGGGFALGSIGMYESLTRAMAKMLNVVLVSVDYRLSPETTYPGGLTDCERVIDYFMANAEKLYGVDTTNVVVMGDSAGGNLATVIVQRRHDGGIVPQFKGQALMYPLLQMADMQSNSYRYFHKRLTGYALVDPESVAYYYMWYAGIDMNRYGHLVKYALVNGHIAPEHKLVVNESLNYTSFAHMDYNETLPERASVIENEELQKLMAPWIANPNFSPIMRKDLSGLPRAFVLTCEFDILRDEGVQYAKRLQDAGVPTRFRHYKNGFHAMLNFHREVSEAADALNEIVTWTKEVFSS